MAVKENAQITQKDVESTQPPSKDLPSIPTNESDQTPRSLSHPLAPTKKSSQNFPQSPPPAYPIPELPIHQIPQYVIVAKD